MRQAARAREQRRHARSSWTGALHQRDDGGVLFVKDDCCAYQFPHEFPDATFRGQLETLLEGATDNFFVVEQRDGALHVLAYEKERVRNDVAAALRATTSVVEEDTVGES